MEMKYCQSCGMPLPPDGSLNGKEKDGSQNADYCAYCYDDGAFKADMTMEQMIEFCVPILVKEEKGMTAEQAREMMQKFFPSLKRWKTA